MDAFGKYFRWGGGIVPLNLKIFFILTHAKCSARVLNPILLEVHHEELQDRAEIH